MNELINEGHYLRLRNGLKKKRKTAATGHDSDYDKNLGQLTETIHLLINTLFELESLKETAVRTRTIATDVEIPAEGTDFNDSVRLYKISLIKNALRQSNGRQNKAAKLLNLKTTTLNSIIKKYKIFD